jgi:hypothetical protein
MSALKGDKMVEVVATVNCGTDILYAVGFGLPRHPSVSLDRCAGVN